MFTDPTLLALASGASRLALNYALWRRFGVTLSVPQALAAALVILAGLPGVLRPLPWPLPRPLPWPLPLPRPFPADLDGCLGLEGFLDIII